MTEVNNNLSDLDNLNDNLEDNGNDNKDGANDAPDDSNQNDESGDDSNNELDNIDNLDDEDGEKEKEEDDEDDEDDESELNSDNVYQDLKAAYPDIFKKHPELKHVIFREREYTNAFPTVDDAKQAVERLETFDSFERDLMSGDPSTILEAVQNTNKDSFNSFVGNFLPSLEKMSKDLHFRVVAPSVKKMLMAASKDPNEAYSKAARNIHHYIFGDFEYANNAGLEVKDLKKEDDAPNEHYLALKQNFDSEVVDGGSKRLMKEITAQFEKSGLSAFMVESLTEKIFKQIGNQLQNNPRHMAEMKTLYKAAEKGKFSVEHKRSIMLAYLRRAKTLIPKVRQEVLAKAKIQLKNRADDKTSGDSKVRIPASGQASRSTGKVDIKKVDFNKSGSDKDVFEKGFVLKDK